jgi:hypothetical protein
MKLLFIAGILCAVLCAASAGAHTNAYFDKIATPHGGQIRMAGPYHLELVAAGELITLYVTDHSDQPIDTAGGSAKVIITSGKKKRYVVILSPAGDNKLSGSGEFKLSKSSAVSVLIAFPDQEPQRASFTLRAAGKASKKSKRRH